MDKEITNQTNGACCALMPGVFPENQMAFTQTDTNVWFDSFFRSSLFVVFSGRRPGVVRGSSSSVLRIHLCAF
jgi:hypothetical protein